MASYQDQAGVAELALKAEVQPSTKPYTLRFYLDADLRSQLAEADSGQHVLQHTAGEMVSQYMCTKPCRYCTRFLLVAAQPVLQQRHVSTPLAVP